MKPAPAREFTPIEGFAICLGMIAIQLSSEVLNQWGFYFYSPSQGVGRTIYVAIHLVWIIFLIGTLWDAITDPLIGVWSDRTATRPKRFAWLRMEGRRRPFIFWGAVGMIATSILFWYPPVEGPSFANLIYGSILICLHWTMFTIAMVPLVALGPEIARSEQARVHLGAWTAVGLIVGLTIAAVAPGLLIEVFDTARSEAGLEEAHSPIGYRRVAALFAGLSFLLFQAPVWLIRERYDSEKVESESVAVLHGLKDAASNYPFMIYAIAFFFFTTGFLAAQRALPSWAELALGGDESTVTVLMAPFILTAMLSLLFIPFLSKRLGVKWMLVLAIGIIASGLPMMYPVGVMAISAKTKTLLGAALFAWCGIGQGIIYVMMTPMMGQVIDYDEARSGQRREALYNGLSGFAWKASMGGAIILASGAMSRWGNDVNGFMGVLLVGPLAGIFALIGLVIMLYYPRLDRP